MSGPRDCRRSPDAVRVIDTLHLLQARVQIEGVALWLGRENPTTTHQCTQANLVIKEKALKKQKGPGIHARRFRASDLLLDFLRQLRL